MKKNTSRMIVVLMVIGTMLAFYSVFYARQSNAGAYRGSKYANEKIMFYW